MFIDSFESLCEDYGVTPSKVVEAIGLKRSSYTGWRKGAEPSNETKKKLADYFGITVKQLMGEEIKKAPANAEADEELSQILEAARNDPDKRILFSLTKNAKPQDVKRIIEMIKIMCGDDIDGRRDY